MKKTNFTHLQFGLVICLLSGFFIIGCSSHDDNNNFSFESCFVEIDGSFQEAELDKSPEYIEGGNEGFVRAFYENNSYPAEARENGIEGLCIIQFDVDTDGSVTNIVVTQDPGGTIGSTAMKTIETITNDESFTPGILNGETVIVRKTLEIRYRLE